MSFPLRMPTAEELEIINRPLTKAAAMGTCPSMDLCFEYNEWVRCGPCSLSIAALNGNGASAAASSNPKPKGQEP